MAKYYNLLVSVASICGLVQSIIWLALSIFGSLLYLCSVPVAPYAVVADFFRVTFFKLYFEGPKCITNGSYLGKFNDEYRNSEKISLMTPDIVFSILIVKIAFDLAHIVICTVLYRAGRKKKNYEKLRDLVIGWSILVLVMSTLEAFLSIELFLDIFSLTNYMDNSAENTADANLRGIQFIPLIFGLVSCRILIFWLWNVIVAAYFLFTAFFSPELFKSEKSGDRNPKPLLVSTTVQTLSVDSRMRYSDLRLGPYKKSHSDWDLYSMEAVTHFNEEITENPSDLIAEKKVPHSGNQNDFLYAFDKEEKEEVDELDHKQWDFTNGGYVNDDLDSEDSPINWDFYRKLQRFEEGLQAIKMVKKPVGKPVKVPIPPPLPKNASFSS